jgi:hypothetical protein
MTRPPEQRLLTEANLADEATNPTSPLGTALSAIAPALQAAEPSGADDTAALNALLASGAGRTVILKAGRTYNISNTLTIRSGTTIDGNGATIDGSAIAAGTAMSQQKVIVGSGTIGSSIKITGAIAKGARVVPGIASTAGLVKGDLVRVRNLQVSTPGSTHTSWTKGELNTVASVDSATQITLESAAILDYADDGNLYIAKVSPLENVTLKNLTVKAGGVGSTHTGIMLTYARNLLIQGVKVLGGEDNGIFLSHVYRGRIDGCTIEDSTSPPPAITNSGYGIVLYDASRYITISNNKFNNCRSFVNGGGSFPVAHVLVTGNYGANCTVTGYSSHEPCFYWTYTNNTAISGNGAGTGFQWRGQYGVIMGNKAIDMPSTGIRVYCEEGTTSQAETIIEGNYLSNCGTGILVDGAIITTGGAESVKYNTVIANNQVLNSQFDGILARYFDKLTITGNQINASGSAGINLLGLTALKQSRHASLSNNQVSNSTTSGIKVNFVDYVSIIGGLIKNSGDRGILLDTCNKTSTSGVMVDHVFANGIRVVSGGQHVLSANIVQDVYTASTDAMAIVNTVDVAIVGGMLSSTRYGINVVGTDKIAITGVHALASTQATKILLDASSVTRSLVGNLGTSSPVS